MTIEITGDMAIEDLVAACPQAIHLPIKHLGEIGRLLVYKTAYSEMSV